MLQLNLSGYTAVLVFFQAQEIQQCYTAVLVFLFLFLYLISSMLQLNLSGYTAVPVFFQKWPKPAKLNILSLGVTTISMPPHHSPLAKDEVIKTKEKCPPDDQFLETSRRRRRRLVFLSVNVSLSRLFALTIW